MSSPWSKVFISFVFLFLVSSLHASINYKSLSILDAKIASEKTGKNILVSFSAGWCLPCQIMEETVYKAPKVENMINEYYIPVKVDFDSPKDSEWFDTYGVGCLPTMSILNKNGEIIDILEGTMTITNMKSVLTKNKGNKEVVDPASIVTTAIKADNRKIVAEVSGQLTPPTLIGIKEDKAREDNQEEIIPQAQGISKNRNAPVAITADKPSLNLKIQFGAFQDYENANAFRINLMDEKQINTIVLEENRKGKTLYKVMQVDIPEIATARALFHKYQRQGIDCFLKTEN